MLLLDPYGFVLKLEIPGLCPTACGILHPALEPSVWKRRRVAGASPEEDHKYELRNGKTLLNAKTGTVGVVQPGEDEDPGKPYCGPSVLKGGL